VVVDARSRASVAGARRASATIQYGLHGKVNLHAQVVCTARDFEAVPKRRQARVRPARSAVLEAAAHRSTDVKKLVLLTNVLDRPCGTHPSLSPEVRGELRRT